MEAGIYQANGKETFLSPPQENSTDDTDFF